jgi:multidrug resistance efflux pump
VLCFRPCGRYNTFNVQRHLISRRIQRQFRTAAHNSWSDATVAAAKAAVTSAKATLKQNEAEFARQATLVTKQVSTQANYDKALALRDSSQADVQSASPTSSRLRSTSVTRT